MRICILSSFEDSLSRNTGYSVRIYNLARGLADLGNKVHVIIPGFPDRIETMGHFFVHRFHGFLPRKILYFVAKLLGIAKPTTLFFYDPLFAFKIRRIIRSVDIVQIEQQASGGFLVPVITNIWKKPIVVDCHDAFQPLRVRHASKIRRFLETFTEIFIYKYADIILTVSEKEKNILTFCGIKKEKIRVVPNGVEIERFSDPIIKPEDVKRKYCLENYRIIVFLGNMEYLPNREAVELIAAKIAPIVCEEVKNVKFLIVGRCSKKIESPNLIFTGVVENSVEPLLISDVAVAPLFQGSGTRLKILEYLACGLPVISTTKGVEGLNLGNGIIIEDDLNEFAKSIIKVLKNQDLAEEMRKNARSLVIHYDWKKILVQLNKIYEELLRMGPR